MEKGVESGLTRKALSVFLGNRLALSVFPKSNANRPGRNFTRLLPVGLVFLKTNLSRNVGRIEIGGELVAFEVRLTAPGQVLHLQVFRRSRTASSRGTMSWASTRAKCPKSVTGLPQSSR